MTLPLTLLLTLNWEATQFPPPGTDGAPPGFWVAGYRVYWRTSSDRELVFNMPFYHSVDVGKTTHWETGGQVPNVWYYYAVTYYDVWGRESDFSNFNCVIYVR